MNARRHSLSISVRGLMVQLRTEAPDGDSVLQDADTKQVMTNSEALAYLAIQQAKGVHLIPCSADCTNPCKHAARGCTGFDPKKGCPGYLIEPLAAGTAPAGREAS